MDMKGQQTVEAWARELRNQFSPQHILLPDGSINQSFFVPDGVILVDDNQWSDELTGRLFQGMPWIDGPEPPTIRGYAKLDLPCGDYIQGGGVKTHGVGSWSAIQKALHPAHVEPLHIQRRLRYLLGIQNLDHYYGWKGGEQEASQEKEENKRLGIELGHIKLGRLWDDPQGVVAQRVRSRMGKGSSA